MKTMVVKINVKKDLKKLADTLVDYSEKMICLNYNSNRLSLLKPAIAILNEHGYFITSGVRPETDDYYKLVLVQ